MYKKITENFEYNFDINQDGLYSITIEATGRKGQHLKVELDGTVLTGIIPGKRDLYYCIPPDWNGNLLKGTIKIVVLVAKLSNGNHILKFKPKGEIQIISEPKITLLPKEGAINILENIQSEEKDRQEWITIALVDLPLKSVEASITCQKRFWESDDVQIIIDDKIKKNQNNFWWGKNWFWQGRKLKGITRTDTFSSDLPQGLHYIELWADKMPILNSFRLDRGSQTYPAPNVPEEERYLNKDKEWWMNWKEIKEYTYKGANGNENYNRYDQDIKEVVAYWNWKFFRDTDPPEEPLDPNLVKAMIFQESYMGYDSSAGNNIMQIGKTGDPSLKTLQGEFPEYWIHNGEEILLKYSDAKVKTIHDSIYWGVRWLYHRAQGINAGKKRYWWSWKEAVKRYGPGFDEYANNVWNIYTQGIDDRVAPSIKLWVVLVLLTFTFISVSFWNYNRVIKLAILNGIPQNEKFHIQDVEVKYDWRNPSLFLATIVNQTDWWEQIHMGRYENGRIKWLSIEEEPTEQSILQAKFLRLKDFSDPILEIYGETHAGHGAFYVYAVKDDSLELLLRSSAVDINQDIRWAPDNASKFGYGNCGEVYRDGRLFSSYRDVNGDDVTDVVLSGTEEKVCEEIKDINSKPLEFDEIKVAESKIEKTFIWDKIKRNYSER